MIKIAGFPNPSGAAYWRIVDPFKYLRRIGFDARVISGGITKEVAEWADVFVLQSVVDKEGIALLHEYQMEHGKKIVVDSDDLINLEDDNPYKLENEIASAKEVITITMEIADLVTVTTKSLYERYKKINPNTVMLPNYMDMERWDLQPKLKNETDTIRIGWAGSMTHMSDLKLVEKPLKRLMDENPKVRLIFCGETRIADLFEGYPVETFLGVPFDAWPSRLNGLRLDIGIAPLRDSEFNRCKSNIKWQEYAINKVPGVYSPTVYNFRGFEPDLGMIAETEEQWYAVLSNMISYPVLGEDIANHAYSTVRGQYDLKQNIYKWKRAYESILDAK